MTQEQATPRGSVSMSLEEVVRLLRSDEVSPSELLAVCLEAIDNRDNDVHAFVHVDVEESCRIAESATASTLRRVDAGPLAGIPFASKDTIDVMGMPTGYGSGAIPPHRPNRNARVVDALAAAGAYCIGKLATTEFAFGDYREPAPKNPWNLLHGAGGSSGGSAAAVAAGFVPLAVAGDTGGSARIPASFCGVSAFRPGRESSMLQGVAPLSPSLDQVAWVARDPVDLFALWTALDKSNFESLDRESRAMSYRIAVVAPWADVQDDVAVAVSQLIAGLSTSGITVENITMAHGRRAAAAAWIITYTEAAKIYGPLIRRHRMDLTPSLVRKVDGAQYFDERDCERACDVAHHFCVEVDEALATADALLLPTVPMTAPRTTDSSYRSDVAIFTRPFSLTGASSLSAPIGSGYADLPIGAQLIGSGRHSARLLALATLLQQQHLLGQTALVNERVAARPRPLPRAVQGAAGLRGAREGERIEMAARDEAERVREDLWHGGRPIVG